MNIAFRVDQGSNPFYLEVLVEFEAGDGDLNAVDLMEAGCSTWTPMVQNWGALWRYNSDTGKALRAPFSLRLTSDSGKVLSRQQRHPRRLEARSHVPLLGELLLNDSGVNWTELCLCSVCLSGTRGVCERRCQSVRRGGARSRLKNRVLSLPPRSLQPR